MNKFKSKRLDVVIYELTPTEAEFFKSKIMNSLGEFKNAEDVIFSNRMIAELLGFEEKIFIKDLFGVY